MSTVGRAVRDRRGGALRAERATSSATMDCDSAPRPVPRKESKAAIGWDVRTDRSRPPNSVIPGPNDRKESRSDAEDVAPCRQ